MWHNYAIVIDVSTKMKTQDYPQQAAELREPTSETGIPRFDQPSPGGWGEHILGMVDDLELLGSGSQKDVYALNDHPNRAIAVFKNGERPYGAREPNLAIKREYYARKILHTLYPDNIPDVYLAASEPAVLITERIDPGPITETRRKIWAHNQRRDQNRLGDQLRKIGVYIDEASPLNFARRTNGSLAYVDDPMVGDWGFNARSIAALHEELAKLPPARRDKAERQLQRWNALMDEEDELRSARLTRSQY